jgi:hypothetical protein
MVPQVPTIWPLAIVQTPVQQSVGLKQMSPTDEQHRPPEQPADAQVPPWQLPEQHAAAPPSPAEPHLLPSVWHMPVEPGMAAQLPLVQMVVQQSVPAEHEAPITLHASAPHLPPAQTFEQQSGPTMHDAPATEHAPPVTAH